jgi:L-lactate dehydrogenase complex protein LldE
MKIQLFVPCFIDQFYPQTALNCIKVLEKAGCEIIYNPEQTCCGQPAFNGGYWKEAKDLALKFLADFNSDTKIVSPSASCVGFIKKYYKELFQNDKLKLEESRLISNGIFELSDFLVNQLNFIDFESVFQHKVTFHDSCSGLREYGIYNEPRILLQNVKGLEIIEMEETSTCCGFGGTFAAKFHHISTAMTQQKVEFALQTGAEYIVSTEASCLMNIGSYIKKQKLKIETIHLADILASWWGS